MITANTADEGTFISNGVFISPGAATNPKLILNGVNIFKGDINISDKDFTILFNANQGSVGELTMGSGNLNLSLDATVSEVAFTNNSSSNWGNGKIVISGFKDNVISFGTNSSGITSEQLNKINNCQIAVINGKRKITFEKKEGESKEKFYLERNIGFKITRCRQHWLRFSLDPA